MRFLSDEDPAGTAPAELASVRTPIPTQIVSNGEFNPLPQTAAQREVEAHIVPHCLLLIQQSLARQCAT